MPKNPPTKSTAKPQAVQAKSAPVWIILTVIAIIVLLLVGAFLWWKIGALKRQDNALQKTNNLVNVTNSSTNTAAANSSNVVANTTNVANNTTGDGSSNAATTKVKIYLIAIDDNGTSGKAIGCGDSVIGVDRTVTATAAPLRVAYEQLLSLHDRDYGESGLMNALYNSNLTIDSVAVANKVATVKLKGTLSSGGTCDDPRIIAQLEQTALQFSTVTSVQVYVNNKKIQDALSTK